MCVHVHMQDKSVASAGRLVMRREKTETLVLNVSLQGAGPQGCALQGDKAVRFSCLARASEAPDAALVPSTYRMHLLQLHIFICSRPSTRAVLGKLGQKHRPSRPNERDAVSYAL